MFYKRRTPRNLELSVPNFRGKCSNTNAKLTHAAASKTHPATTIKNIYEKFKNRIMIQKVYTNKKKRG
jgi:hypothetical protein